MNYLLFNPLASNGSGAEIKEQAKNYLVAETEFKELTEINVLEFDKRTFLTDLKEEDVLILVGGDGTLNRFANEVYELQLPNNIYLYRAGTGNDFLRDLNNTDNLVLLNDYLKHLPRVKINGKETYFINGVGYGIDGMVCEVADDLKAKGKKDINYTSIAIKLLLTKYKRPNATVFVDGKEYHFKKVWFASAMNGRYYGGGMKVAPGQNRMDNTLSFVTMHKSSRLRTLMIFPSIFEGKHLEKKKYCMEIKGNRIEVKFDRPTSLQIDGEVIRNVIAYEAFK